VSDSKMFGLGMGLDLAHDKRGSSLVMSDHLDRLERGEFDRIVTVCVQVPDRI
jgi:hypothetical protein